MMVRQKMGRRKHASAGVLDSQSVKSTCVLGKRGFDSAKRVKGRKRHVQGRKRHVLSDTCGLPLEILVTCANVSEGQGAKQLLQRAGRRRGPIKQVRHVWADAGYKKGIIEWCLSNRGIVLEIVTASRRTKRLSNSAQALGERKNLLVDLCQPQISPELRSAA